MKPLHWTCRSSRSASSCSSEFFINFYSTILLLYRDDYHVITTSTDPKVVVAYLKMKKFHLEEKTAVKEEDIMRHLKNVLKLA